MTELTQALTLALDHEPAPAFGDEIAGLVESAAGVTGDDAA